MSRFEFPANENGGAEIALQFGEVTVIRFGAEELAAKIEGRRREREREREREAIKFVFFAQRGKRAHK